jgi:uncharacterized protein YndB with AHSA1/START domain
MTLDTFTIEKEITLHAPRSRVWRALTDVREFEQWFGMKMEAPFSVGARVAGRHTHPDWAHLPFDMIIEAMEPEHTFVWLWHPGMPEPDSDFESEPRTRVAFSLDEVAEGTLLRVVETGFGKLPDPRMSAAFAMNSEGWNMQLGNIKRYVEGDRAG